MDVHAAVHARARGYYTRRALCSPRVLAVVLLVYVLPLVALLAYTFGTYTWSLFFP